MLKIERSAHSKFVIFTLSGRIEMEDVAELQRLFEAEDHNVIMNLKEVTLVDRDAVRFLARCEADSIKLEDCPAYIREWILRERDQKTGD
jgi:anti-anti-sigma regulatory factor